MFRFFKGYRLIVCVMEDIIGIIKFVGYEGGIRMRFV